MLLALLASTAAAAPPSSGFLYQGRLTQAGTAPSGAFDFQFLVFNAPAGAGQVGSTRTFNDVAVSLGLFNVELDFGNELFTGEALWLEVRVRVGTSTGSYTTLTPRQPLRLFALNGKQAPLKTPLTGLVTVGLFSDEVTGVGTFFTEEIDVGDSILLGGETHTVAQIDNDSRLFLQGLHGTGALSAQAFTDGILLRVQAGDLADVLVAEREGVRIGEQGTPTSRIEHGTIGDCGSGSLSDTGSVTFSTPFLVPPRVFLTTDRTDNQCFTASTTDVSNTGFAWESWGQNAAIYIGRKSCRCITWMAVGI
ncbi:MAG TPA: H-type lectin domain-containing protein [Thermoanaerobaculia bacterium]